MKLNEVEALLAIISSLDRRQFPEGASGIWYEVLRNVAFEDAKAAVVEYFGSGVDEVPTLLPGRVRAGAARIRQVREASRPAITAAPPKPAAQVRSEEFEAAMAKIRKATAEAVEHVRARDPQLKPYRHRRASLTRVA